MVTIDAKITIIILIFSIKMIYFITLIFSMMLYFLLLNECCINVVLGGQLEIAHPNYRSGFSTSEWKFGVIVYTISVLRHQML